MDIAGRLRIARNAIGYTLKKAEKESGIGYTSISAFENRNREPSFSQLSCLAEVYKKTIDFFLSDTLPIEAMPLWRDEPATEEERKETEARFHQLCEQYHRLELCYGEIKRPRLPAADVELPEELTYRHVESVARKVREQFALGDTPGPCLKTRLEETYYVKIFYLDFPGSAISSVSEVFGPAILLNRRNKPWRRTYDLAHEVFHLLTWTLFRTKNAGAHIPSTNEESLANKFASILLMPEESLRERLDTHTDSAGNLSLHHLDDISREYDVSLDALICRIASIFRFKKEETEMYRDLGKKYVAGFEPRPSCEPQQLPERYRDLAVRALRVGRLSLMQFAKYMNLSYKKAQEYLTEDDEFRDEKISIPIA
jgi:Zn-dependent peptidase ImmA (M78 family)